MIGQRIQDLLLAKHKSAYELAEHVGVTPQAAYKWLDGSSEPRGRRKTAIASFFGISAQELEYGVPVNLSAPLPSTKKFTSNLDLAIAENAAALLVEAELTGKPRRSKEYYLGMKHRLIESLSGKHQPQIYNAGTSEADAYELGLLHGERLIDKLQSNNA